MKCLLILAFAAVYVQAGLIGPIGGVTTGPIDGVTIAPGNCTGIDIDFPCLTELIDKLLESLLGCLAESPLLTVISELLSGLSTVLNGLLCPELIDKITQSLDCVLENLLGLIKCLVCLLVYILCAVLGLLSDGVLTDLLGSLNLDSLLQEILPCLGLGDLLGGILSK